MGTLARNGLTVFGTHLHKSQISGGTCHRSVIKENTARVVAARQINVLFSWRAILNNMRVIKIKLNIGKKITGLKIMTLNREISSMFPDL